MRRKFLTTFLITVLMVSVISVTQAMQPAASQARPERQLPAHVQALSAEEQANIDTSSAQVLRPPRALTGADRKSMLVIELEQAPMATYFANQKASGRSVDAADLNSYRAGLEKAQAAVQTRLEAAGVEVVSHYTAAYNGFLAYVPQSQVEAIRSMPGVIGVRPAPQHVPSLSASVPLIGAPEVWNELGVDGDGIVIAIIDTGIDYTHGVFGGSGDPEDYANNNPDIIEEGTFPTAKVVGGWDFAGTTYNADDSSAGYQPIPHPDDDPLDEYGHGTHVASISAGNAFGQVSDGVAPGANLWALKVFGAEGSTNLVMDALDKATANYLEFGWPQVINMSLGASYGPGDALEDPDVASTNAAVEAGIVVVASSGNSGDVYYITGSPASSSKAISVSATTTGWATNPTVNVDGSEDPDLADIIYAPPAFSDDGQYKEAITAKLADAGVYSDPLLCDGAVATPANAFEGKIVLIERGVCAFTEKVRTAKSLGAAGVLIFNSAAGGNTYSTMADDGLGGLAPAGFLARDDGLNLKDVNGQTVTVSAVSDVSTVIDRYTPADSLADFSSRGPRGTDSRLKPEIGAPGYGIFAANMGSGSGGVSMSGTSMAAPHVAGVAALMVQAHPDWTPEAIKAAMMNTAVDLVDDSSIPQMGAGRVDAFKAVSTSSFAVGDEDLVSISDYVLYNVDNVSFDRPVTIHNTDDEAHTYALSWEYQGDSLSGLDITFPMGDIEVDAGKTAGFDATFTFDMTEIPAEVLEMEEIYGYIILTPDEGDTLRVPFYFVPRPYNDLSVGASPGEDAETDWATFDITQTGPITSSLNAFPLMVVDGRETGTAGDIRAVGVDYGGNSPYGPVIAFAVNAWEPWHLPHYYFAEFDIYVDIDEDGEADYVIYNGPYSAAPNIFLAFIYDLNSATGTNSPYPLYADFNSGYMEFYVPAAYLGLSSDNTTFDFQVIGFDMWGNSDESAPGRFDFAHYPFDWDFDTYEPGPNDPSAKLIVSVEDPDGYDYSNPLGVMIVDYTGSPRNGGEVYTYAPVQIFFPFWPR